MGHRLSRIYTRTGDDGMSGLADGSRLAKHHPRLEAIGEVDELNSALGVFLAERPPEALRAALAPVQHMLFEFGAILASPGRGAEVVARAVPDLEGALDGLNAGLPPLREFILPGGGRAAASCHLARSVCRRAERRLSALIAADPAAPGALLIYLNRLSDLLFVAARVAARGEDSGDVPWRPVGPSGATP